MTTLYDVNEIKKIFSCGKNTAYDIMNSSGFPSIRVGRKIFVEKEEFEKWLQKNAGKRIKI